ncbi:MAG: deoxyhypusine synthase family protein, partial [Phycisphaerae bacterium]
MQNDSPQDKRVARAKENFGDGWAHNLQPLEPFDVFKAGSFSEMLAQLKRTAFGARNLGEAADVLYEMVTDPKCLVVGTFSGALTIAKMGLLIADMIDQGLLDAVISTGALIGHGLVEQSGRTHFRHDPSWNDEKLYKAGYDRVYDTLELEQNLYDTEAILVEVLRGISPDEAFGSRELNAWLGAHLCERYSGRGILQSAYRKGVPVYVPAFTDSEMGLDVYTYNALAARAGRPGVRFDPLRDVDDFLKRISAAERLGLFTIGGGVPRNWAQQAGPLAELLYFHTKGETGGLVRFRYGVRICPEPVHWGGLSGCTFSEGVSWGKFVPPSEGGRYAEVLCDATIAWPILV